MEARIGGVMLVAESAALRSAQEVLILCGCVCVAVMVIAVVEYLQGERDE